MKTASAISVTADSGKEWQKTQLSNLISYVSSGNYFARIRVRGKLIRKSLKTDALTTAKLCLGDLKKRARGGRIKRIRVMQFTNQYSAQTAFKAGSSSARPGLRATIEKSARSCA
jgi:hypothetical protein